MKPNGHFLHLTGAATHASPPKATEHQRTGRLDDLRHLLDGSFLALFQMPARLEQAFRHAIRALAARFLQRSIYMLIAIYLVVVTPVLWLFDDPSKQVWFWWAVFPIGVVLAWLWVASRFPQCEQYVEVLLGVSVWVCLSGTLFAALKLEDATLGYVAGFESVYITIIAFSVLRIRAAVALLACLMSVTTAILLAVFMQVPIDWLGLNLFFAAPLLVGLVNGYIQESTNRRDFIQATYQHRQVALLKDIMLAGDTEDDESVCLNRALRSVVEAMGWQAMCICAEDEQGHLRLEAALNVERPFDDDLDQLPGPWCWPGVDQLIAGMMPGGSLCESRLVDDAGEQAMYCLAVPVPLGRHQRAVMLCFAEQAQDSDSEFVDFMIQVGDHLGRILDRMRQKQMLQRMALYDSLTGLKNRIAFMQSLEAALARKQRRNDFQFAVLFMDMDRFKWVNDHLGHQAGDRLLEEFSARLRNRFRANDTVARLGGDEFAVLLEDVDLDHVLQLVSRVQETYDDTIEVAGEQLHLIASIGIAMAGDSHHSADAILGEADAAMYTAKTTRKGSYCVFEESIRHRVEAQPRYSR